MKVKIIKSSELTYWYADKIGQIFNVDPNIRPASSDCRSMFLLEPGDDYVVLDKIKSDDSGTGFLISVNDCEVCGLKNRYQILKEQIWKLE